MKLNENIRKEIVIILLLLSLTVIYFNNLIFKKELFLSGDMYNFFYSQRIYAQKSFQNGSFPFWNTDIFCGAPYIDDIQNALFYPFTILFYISSAYFAITITLVTHIFMAGWFLYLLMRQCFHIDRRGSLISAIIYMFSGFFTMHMEHLNQVMSCAWSPLIILTYIKSTEEKKILFIMLMAVSLGLQLLTGGSQNTFYLIIILFLLSIYLGVGQYISTKNLKEFSQPMLFLITGIFISLAVAAVQILPTYQLASMSRRANGLSFGEASADSLLPLQFFINIILPNYFGYYGKQPYWGIGLSHEMVSYIGIFPLALSFYALFKIKRDKYVYFFGITSIIALIFAMGKYTPVYQLFLEFGFDRFRSPSRFIYIYHLSIAILAGFGINRLFSKEENKSLADKTATSETTLQSSERLPEKDASLLRASIILLLIVVSSLLYFLTNYPIERFSKMSLSVDDYRSMWYRDAFITMTSIVSLFFIFERSISKRIKEIIIFSAIFFSLLSFTSESKFRNAHISSGTDLQKSSNQIVTYLQNDRSLYRIFSIGTRTLIPNTGTLFNIADIGGYGGGILPFNRYAEFAKQVADLKEGILLINFEILNMLNVKYIVSDLDIKYRGYKRILTAGNTNLYLNSNFLPRAYLVDSADQLKTSKEILDYFSKGNVNFTKELFLEEKVEYQGREDKEKAKNDFAHIKTYAPNFIEIEAGLTKQGFLFLSDSYHPGWIVYIDGRQGKILRANYNFRGIALNKGLHKVRFMYRPVLFYIGLAISCITMLSFLIFLLSKFRNQRVNIFS